MRIHRNSLPACLVFTTLMGAAPAHAQEHHGEPEAHHHKNVIAFFLGGATEERRDKGAAFGIEYERRLGASWGLGLVAERTYGDFDVDVFVVPVAFHSGPWKTYVAPGIEDGPEGSERLIRVGVEYGFEAGRWEIAPQFDFDFVDGERVAVLGVTFGFGF
ncbi:MAG: hypothetical protein AAFN78_12915 [Pseudomonadota bacterium]